MLSVSACRAVGARGPIHRDGLLPDIYILRWHFIPYEFIVVTMLEYHFLGECLHDAEDPYAEHRKSSEQPFFYRVRVWDEDRKPTTPTTCNG